MRRNLNVSGEYVGHLVVGAGMFAALLPFGVALHVLVEWTEPFVGDRTFLPLMTIVEKVILYLDVFFVVWWAMVATFKGHRGTTR